MVVVVTEVAVVTDVLPDADPVVGPIAVADELVPDGTSAHTSRPNTRNVATATKTLSDVGPCRVHNRNSWNGFIAVAPSALFAVLRHTGAHRCDL
jgi:hypothetical protein